MTITIVIETDADPSQVLDLAIEAAKAIAAEVDGEADEDSVCVSTG